MAEPENKLVGTFLRMRSKVARSVAGIVPRRDLEDVVQDTFLRIHDLRKPEGIRNPEAFIYQTARNLALDHVKRAEARLVDGCDDIDCIDEFAIVHDHDMIFQQFAAGRDFGELCNAVHQLPDQCRRVFILRKVYGFSQREIAAELGISQSAVEKHVARGLRQIHSAFSSGPSQERPRGAVIADLDTHRARRYRS